MQQKTHGIVLHTTKYGDSGTIITVLTREFGRISYAVNGLHKKRSGIRPVFLQPLSLVEMEVLHKPGREIQRIKEMHLSALLNSIPSDPVKNAIAIFIAEVLYRVLKQSEPDEQLFLYIYKGILLLDVCEDGVANFHPVFIGRLTRFLGFEPNLEHEDALYFDLMNGLFVDVRPLHVHYIQGEEMRLFRLLLSTKPDDIGSLELSRVSRIKILNILIEYYRLHIPDFYGINSLSVLHSLFD